MKTKKFAKTEKVIIAMDNGENYNTYRCDEHGVFQKRKDVDDSKCPYCKKACNPVENIDELRQQFKKELGYE